jgi:hypothetical protein
LTYIKAVLLLLVCALIVLLMESDVKTLADVISMGAIDVVFLLIYALLLFGVIQGGLSVFRRIQQDRR